ncbi:hypothetical protein AFLA_005819 [Aspergillus flavus NRRL3357]|nr:hypothetical protein AFLA_005819 [Aspergillus flavus NRRL3357]
MIHARRFVEQVSQLHPIARDLKISNLLYRKGTYSIAAAPGRVACGPLSSRFHRHMAAFFMAYSQGRYIMGTYIK